MTDLGERLFWTAVCAGVVVRRHRADVARLAPARGPPGRRPAAARRPADTGAPITAAEVVYVVTTTAGDWLDRIAARGLGVRSRAALAVYPTGVLVDRDGAPALWIPAAAVRGARLERGMAGKFTEEGGLIAVTWAHGDRLLDTGLRALERDRHRDLVAASAPSRQAPTRTASCQAYSRICRMNRREEAR